MGTNYLQASEHCPRPHAGHKGAHLRLARGRGRRDGGGRGRGRQAAGGSTALIVIVPQVIQVNLLALVVKQLPQPPAVLLAEEQCRPQQRRGGIARVCAYGGDERPLTLPPTGRL